MPEVSSTAVLKQVLKDISNVHELIEDSSGLHKALKNNSLDKEELDQIIEKTRSLIEKLKSEVDRISIYFNERCVSCENGEEVNEGDSSRLADKVSDTPEVVENGNADLDEHDCDDGANADVINGRVVQDKDADDGGGEKEKEEVTSTSASTSNDVASETAKTNLDSTNNGNLEDNSHKLDATLEKSVDNLQTSRDNLEISTDIFSQEEPIDATPQEIAEVETDATPQEKIPEAEMDVTPQKIPEAETDATLQKIPEAEMDATPQEIPEAEMNATFQKIPEAEKDAAPQEIPEAGTNVPSEGSNEEMESADKSQELPSDDNDDALKEEQTTWKIKCVDISKLINPDLLSKSTDEEPVVVLSDSDADGNTKKEPSKLLSLLQTNELVVKQIQKNKNITITRQSKGVIVLDDSDSSDDIVLSKISKSKPPENNAKTKDASNVSMTQDKKRKSVRFNVSDESEKEDVNKKKVTRAQVRSRKTKKYIDSSSDEETCNTKVKKKQRKKHQRDLTSVSSFSDTNSNTDSDDDKHKKSSRKKALSKEDSAALEKRLITSQQDSKFSWRVYVPLAKITADQLKENYKKRLLKDEINRLTNLDSLKRSHHSAKGSQSSDSADSTAVKKQRVQISEGPPADATPTKTQRDSLDATAVEIQQAQRCEDLEKSTSEKSDCENEDPAVDPLALPEEIELQNQVVPNKEDNIITAVLEEIHSGSESSLVHDDVEAEAKGSPKIKASKTIEKETKQQDNDDAMNTEQTEKEGDPEVQPVKDKSWRKDKLLTGKLSETDSDENFEKFVEKKKKLAELPHRTGKRKVRIVNSDSDSSCKRVSSEDENSEKESQSSDSSDHADKTKNTKRRRIKTIQDSSDESENEKSTRKNIRKVWTNDSLAETTKQAEKEEQERKTRIAERQKKYNQLFNVDELQKAKVDKVVLDFNEETKEELLQVDKKIVKYMKPHQAKGVQFMWTACFESLDRAKNTKGSGCILAHCMGLGKTLQVIALVHALLGKAKETGVSKVLVVTPLNTVLNWVAEFKKWLPDEDEVDVYELVSYKQNYERQYEVQQWSKDGGVLIIGYDMFRNLTNPTNKRLNKKMRNVFHTSLVEPGPDLVVCDEGHLLKNEKTSLSIAMNRLHTLRRIVLTGTPLQNNLKEYFCMVQFVKPNLLGTYKEYLNRFVNPITNGQYTDSTQHDTQLMRKRSHVLHKLLDGIVQRRDYAVLAPFLPPKYEYVLFINLTEVQVKLYEHYLKEKAQIRTSSKGKSYLFIDFQEFLRICTHPRVLSTKPKKDILEDEEEDSEGSLKDFIDDKEESTTSTNGSDSNSGSASENENESVVNTTKHKRLTRSTADQIVISDHENEPDPSDPSEWWRQYCQNDELECLNYSGKLFVLFEILHECEQIGDKILVFSQSLYSLDVIEYFLSKVDEATQSEKSDTSAVGGHPGSWSLGLDYFRLDGSSSCDNRASWCKTFNDPENTRARLFLISTRAGGLGINLVAANRVIIFDVSWNPSHDVQSIYRVYRFGQLKPCYVYRFVTLGTMEMKIYERQVIKQAISKRVIDEQQIDRHYNQNDLAELYKFEPKPDEDRPIPLVPKDILLGEMLQKFGDRIYKFHEHQSLLENKEEECLNEDERKAAWEEFEYEKKVRQFPNVLNNIPIQTVVLALTSIIQKDNPSWDTAAVQSIVPQLVTELEQQLQFGNMSMYNRILNEVRLMQSAKQQQRLQDYYYRQQQQALMMRQYQMFKQNAAKYPTGSLNFNSTSPFVNPGPSATSSPVAGMDIIDLND